MWVVSNTNNQSSNSPRSTGGPTIPLNSDTDYPGLVQALQVRPPFHKTASTSDVNYESQGPPALLADSLLILGFPQPLPQFL